MATLIAEVYYSDMDQPWHPYFESAKILQCYKALDRYFTCHIHVRGTIPEQGIFLSQQ